MEKTAFPDQPVGDGMCAPCKGTLPVMIWSVLVNRQLQGIWPMCARCRKFWMMMCCTVRQVAAEVQISTGSVHSILRKDLDLRKKASKFIPCLLTQEQKELRVRLCRENLKECQDPLFLWSVITSDESWFSVLEPEQKQHSLQWVEHNAPRPKKAIRS